MSILGKTHGVPYLKNGRMTSIDVELAKAIAGGDRSEAVEERLQALTDAVLQSGQVFVRILAAGIAGVDNIQRAGGYLHPLAKNPGFSPGYDIVGEIVTLGDAVPSDDM